MSENGRDDDIGRLIREAGPRPEVPPEKLSAIRDATRAAWRAEVARRRGRRTRRALFALAASLLVAVLGVSWWLGRATAPPAGPVATVELASGPAEARPPGTRDGAPGEGRALVAGSTLDAGEVLTLGGSIARDASLALRLPSGASVRLPSGARLRMVSASRIELLHGSVYVDSDPSLPQSDGLEVLTPVGIVREIGTQFEVGLAEDAVRVRVREGAVRVSLDGTSHEATAGEEITVQSDGTADRVPLQPTSSLWRWAEAAAPPLDIEGRSLDTFLRWAARETGRALRYADDALALTATDILLHGSIEGLVPDEALGVILEGSGLGHRMENGTILVIRS